MKLTHSRSLRDVAEDLEVLDTIRQGLEARRLAEHTFYNVPVIFNAKLTKSTSKK